MPQQPRSHILELAKRGAEVRARELLDELRLLVGLFPHLRDSFDKDELPVRFILAEGGGRTAVRSAGGRGMSSAQRKAVSVRMKNYWAAKRNTPRS
jgi:hypothetical protein